MPARGGHRYAELVIEERGGRPVRAAGRRRGMPDERYLRAVDRDASLSADDSPIVVGGAGA